MRRGRSLVVWAPLLASEALSAVPALVDRVLTHVTTLGRLDRSAGATPMGCLPAAVAAVPLVGSSVQWLGADSAAGRCYVAGMGRVLRTDASACAGVLVSVVVVASCGAFRERPGRPGRSAALRSSRRAARPGPRRPGGSGTVRWLWSRGRRFLCGSCLRVVGIASVGG